MTARMNHTSLIRIMKRSNGSMSMKKLSWTYYGIAFDSSSLRRQRNPIITLKRFSSIRSDSNSNNIINPNNQQQLFEMPSNMIRIGNVERKQNHLSSCPSLIPSGYIKELVRMTTTGTNNNTRYDNIELNELIHLLPQTMIQHLQWIMIKDNIQQDIILIGVPGDNALYRKHLILSYAELMQREIEIVTLSSDITADYDLKQRREIIMNTNNGHTEVQYYNQGPVRSALYGRILLLDGGLQTVDRNVLPTLNNLLENREMNLDDGRCLVSPKRYNELMKMNYYNNDNQNKQLSLIPTHSDFRVMALVDPVPPFPGRTLDPPLRSRFQMRRIPNINIMNHEIISSSIPKNTTNMNDNNNVDQHLMSFINCIEQYAMENTSTNNLNTAGGHNRTLLFPGISCLRNVTNLIHTFPNEDPILFIQRYYPIVLSDQKRKILNQRDDMSKVTNKKGTSRTKNDLAKNPNTNAYQHPFWLALQHAKLLPDPEKQHVIQDTRMNSYEMKHIARNCNNPEMADVTFLSTKNKVHNKSVFSIFDSTDKKEETVTISVPCGKNIFDSTTRSSSSFMTTDSSKYVLTGMMQEHYVNRDILLLSLKGNGKTSIAMEFANILGYNVHLFGLYKDMTSRDLLMRRNTDSNTGETIWEASPLVQAALLGDICILDGIDKLSSDTIATLHGLMNDREISLPNGKRLVRYDRYKEIISRITKQKEFNDSNVGIVIDDTIIPIPSTFRIIALGNMDSQQRGNQSSSNSSPLHAKFINETTMSMFSTIILPQPSDQDLLDILKSVDSSYLDDQLKQLLNFHNLLVTDNAYVECGISSSLSIRNLIRIIKLSQKHNSNLSDIISSVLMVQLLPPNQRKIFDSLLVKAGILSPKKPNEKIEFSKKTLDANNTFVIDDDSVYVGKQFVMKQNTNVKHPEMVPSPIFFDIPQHVNTISNLLQEWKIGERAFLLIGNQGVGKNKIVDRLCQIANFEREYMQLHRDSTVGQLTLSPSLVNGKIIWNDSPLVRSIRDGYSLVLDEADKAPLETITILKNLIEDGELLLADGRRISRTLTSSSNSDTIPIHPDFTIWILANRPGFPFHGNDFYREVGDCLSSHAIPNPDPDSEMILLQSYAPNVDPKLLRQIVHSFDELRQLSEEGELSYPYSTREAVSVAKHLESQPGIIEALHNILDMDSFDDRLYNKLCDVFRRNGIPMTSHKTWLLMQASGDGRNTEKLSILYSGNDQQEGVSSNPPPLKGPKLGKWDEKNEAHVGGNQWQGGTGGSDTAGLGGRGGPFRLDRGHKVHQVSDEAKAQVSKEAAEAARRMAEQGLKDRLNEIGMSSAEWDMYDELVEPIRSDISNLRGLLKSVKSSNTERTWIKRQRYGELDDSKIVDGVTGDKNIFKRRGYADPDADPSFQGKKRIRFVMDCSASMYRFNGRDKRLNRSLEAAALIMESFVDMEHQFDYSMVGHSGDSACIPLIEFGCPPNNALERMRILQQMVAHTQYCQSGDNTLPAINRAMLDVGASDVTDQTECFVVAISDANLYRYGIQPKELGQIMRGQSLSTTESIPKAFCIFVASFGEEANEIQRELPLGRGFICNNTKELPRIVRDILSSIA